MVFTNKVIHLFVHSTNYIIFRPGSIFAMNLEHRNFNIEFEVPGKYDQNIFFDIVCDYLEHIFPTCRLNFGYLNILVKLDVGILKLWVFICHSKILDKSTTLNYQNFIEEARRYHIFNLGLVLLNQPHILKILWSTILDLLLDL